MNCKAINVLLFAVGAAIGSAVTWRIVKTRYERIAQEEIDSVKMAFNELMANQLSEDEREKEPDVWHGRHRQIDWSELEDLEDEEDDEEDDNTSDFQEYGRLIDNYTNNEEKGGAKRMAKAPYVIAPYDFGELDDYRKFELTYYADGVLEDEDYNIINDSEELIGRDSLNTFGEYEDDAVFVRNEALRSDFQILKDYRTYAEARSIGPNQVDDE